MLGMFTATSPNIRLHLKTISSFHCLEAGHLTFGQVFGQGLHVVRSVLPGGVGAQMSPHRLHLLLQGRLRVLLGSLSGEKKDFKGTLLGA